MPLFDVQQLSQIIHAFGWLQDEEEINISMHILLGEGNVRLYFDADGGDYADYLCCNLSVFLRRERFCVFESVSSHRRLSFFYKSNHKWDQT